MNDLLDNPLWRPGDLGRPIPDSPHAVSVCLPTWRDNVGYEEGEPRVHDNLTTGYPRFVYNGLCRALFAECERRFAQEGETCLAFPSAATAERFGAFLRDQGGCAIRLHEFGLHNVHVVCFPTEHAGLARDRWQHCGEGISSRQAAACLGEGGKPRAESRASDAAKRGIRERIAGLVGDRSLVPDATTLRAVPGVRDAPTVSADDVFLFPCGMNAIYALHRVLCAMFPGRKSVQFGFPYVDTLKIQQKFGPGAHFFPRGDADELQQAAKLVEREPISGLYTEFPSNPLLICPDVEPLAKLARRHEFPLILDETIASFVNADLLSAADVLTTSLTKFFSGVGDVTGGSLVLNPRSPFYGELSRRLKGEEDVFWGEDAIVLEHNSRDFEDRMRGINAGAEAVADFLHGHSKVAEVCYPKYQTPHHYGAFLKAGGGYSGLMSVTLDDGPRAAPAFFDGLRISKGPNLGMNYSLACPYTILAHYRELDFAESCGVSRWLIRLSAGLEPPDDLIHRLEEALSAV